MDVSVRQEIVPDLHKYHTSQSDIPSDAGQVKRISNEWIVEFQHALVSGSPESVLALFVSDTPILRDLLVLSWNLRTLIGAEIISEYLKEHFKPGLFITGAPGANIPPMVMRPASNVGWIVAFMEFTTVIKHGTIVVRLIPIRTQPDDEIVQWRAHGVLMDLDGLNEYPWLLGQHRKQDPVFGTWEDDLAKESAFTDHDPTVIIIGGSQSGLGIAARLKALGVFTLVLERSARIGDSWRNRYDALCLHDTIWANHLPYLPFPPTWPVYIPGKKLADWLEHYASILELPIWTSANVSKIVQDGNGWMMKVDRPEGSKVLRAKYVVFAVGRAGKPLIPAYPTLKEFKGYQLHSSIYNRGTEFIGKKVAVIGASTSAHDISMDLAKHGVDVTMVQRGPIHIMSNQSIRRALALWDENGPPTDIADRIAASVTVPLNLALSLESTQFNKEADKELLQGLRDRGFQTFDGPGGTGLWGLLFSRGGGYYFNTGACDLIIDGSIKAKASKIVNFTPNHILFEDGSDLEADVIVWATGYYPGNASVRALLSDQELADQFQTLGRLNAEGELGGAWQDSGVKGLYLHTGNLAMGRYFSKHLALRIKAIEQGFLPQ